MTPNVCRRIVTCNLCGVGGTVPRGVTVSVTVSPRLNYLGMLTHARRHASATLQRHYSLWRHAELHQGGGSPCRMRWASSERQRHRTTDALVSVEELASFQSSARRTIRAWACYLMGQPPIGIKVRTQYQRWYVPIFLLLAPLVPELPQSTKPYHLCLQANTGEGR